MIYIFATDYNVAPKSSRLNVGLACLEMDAVLTSPFSSALYF